MKKNYFLRTALLLLVLCILTSGVFLGTGTVAKYIAAGEGEASARVAKFSVKVIGQGQRTAFELADAASVAAGEALDLSTKNETPFHGAGYTPPTGSAHDTANCEDEAACKVVALADSITFFSGIFSSSYESDSKPDYNPDTVISSDGGLVVAPGTNNAGGTEKIRIWNESEVAVKITAQLLEITGVGGDGEGKVPSGSADCEVPIQIWSDSEWKAAADLDLATAPADLGDAVDLPPNQEGYQDGLGTLGTDYVEFDAIEWQWIFDGRDDVYTGNRSGAAPTAPKIFTDTDIFDTLLGIHAQTAADQVKFKIMITATQID